MQIIASAISRHLSLFFLFPEKISYHSFITENKTTSNFLKLKSTLRFNLNPFKEHSLQGISGSHTAGRCNIAKEMEGKGEVKFGYKTTQAIMTAKAIPSPLKFFHAPTCIVMRQWGCMGTRRRMPVFYDYRSTDRNTQLQASWSTPVACGQLSNSWSQTHRSSNSPPLPTIDRWTLLTRWEKARERETSQMNRELSAKSLLEREKSCNVSKKIFFWMSLEMFSKKIFTVFRFLVIFQSKLLLPSKIFHSFCNFDFFK